MGETEPTTVTTEGLAPRGRPAEETDPGDLDYDNYLDEAQGPRWTSGHWTSLVPHPVAALPPSLDSYDRQGRDLFIQRGPSSAHPISYRAGPRGPRR
jgi:hypothetical protein